MPPSSTQAVAPRGFLADWSVSAVAAGFLAVLISYAGPLVIFFQAAQAAHAIFPAVRPGVELHFEYSTTKGVPGMNGDQPQPAGEP